MYNPLLVKQASPAEDEQAQLEALERWRRPGKQPEISPDVRDDLEKLKEVRSRAGKRPEQYESSTATPRRGVQPSLEVRPPDYTLAASSAHRLGQVFGTYPPTASQESKPAGQQPAQQSQQQSTDPEWSGMYGKDAWRDYQMHKKYMNDPEYKAYTEWYNQNKGRYGTPQQPQQQPAQQPQQPAGGIQPGPGWQTGPSMTSGQSGGWSLPPLTPNRPNPDYNPASTGLWPHKGNMPYITPEGELTTSPYGGSFKPKGGGMGGMFGGSGPGMSWEDTRRALMM